MILYYLRSPLTTFSCSYGLGRFFRSYGFTAYGYGLRPLRLPGASALLATWSPIDDRVPSILHDDGVRALRDHQTGNAASHTQLLLEVRIQIPRLGDCAKVGHGCAAT